MAIKVLLTMMEHPRRFHKLHDDRPFAWDGCAG